MQFFRALCVLLAVTMLLPFSGVAGSEKKKKVVKPMLFPVRKMPLLRAVGTPRAKTLSLLGAYNRLPQQLTNPVQIQKYANRWLVIVGGAAHWRKTQRMQKKQKVKAQMLVSTHYARLNPGWTILVQSSHSTKAEAEKASLALKKKGVSNYVKFSGSRFAFQGTVVRSARIKGEVRRKLRSHCYAHKGKVSPNGKIKLIFKEIDPMAAEITIVRGEKKQKVKGAEFQSEKMWWSSDSRFVALVETDFYSGDGDRSIVLLDVEKAHVQKYPLKAWKKLKRVGKREFFQVSKLCWSRTNNEVLFSLSIDYLGSSGHPGIDIGRKKRLGEFFGKRDPIFLGQIGLFFQPK